MATSEPKQPPPPFPKSMEEIAELQRDRVLEAIDNASIIIDTLHKLHHQPTDQLLILYCAAFATARANRTTLAGARQSTRLAFEIVESLMMEFGR